jgi:hypothetical protein
MQTYDVLSYANFQPGTWAMASEGDYRSLDAGGAMENSTSTVHLVVTFAGNEIVMYRNGQKYGTTYTKRDPTYWLANKTRVVFGVRGRPDDGTAGDWNTSCGRPTKHGDTHSPFFSGRILSATLLNSALYDVEVLGLYEAAQSAGDSPDRGWRKISRRNFSEVEREAQDAKIESRFTIFIQNFQTFVFNGKIFRLRLPLLRRMPNWY